MAKPVVIVTAGGKPVINTPGALPATPVAGAGIPITLVLTLGTPMSLINEDGTAWSESGAPSLDFSQTENSQYLHLIFED